jgi:hypothetical protein
MNLIVVNALPNPDILDEAFYVVDTEWIWKKIQGLLLMGEEYDNTSLQFKKKWIKEALDMLVEIEIIKKGQEKDTWIIPKKLGSRRKPIQKIICKKLSNLKIKREMRSQFKIKTPFPSGKEKKLTDFL